MTEHPRLPLPAETMIRMAALKLQDSRRNFRSRQVLAALDYLHEVLRVYGQLPWPPKPEEIPHAHQD